MRSRRSPARGGRAAAAAVRRPTPHAQRWTAMLAAPTAQAGASAALALQERSPPVPRPQALQPSAAPALCFPTRGCRSRSSIGCAASGMLPWKVCGPAVAPLSATTRPWPIKCSPRARRRRRSHSASAGRPLPRWRLRSPPFLPGRRRRPAALLASILWCVEAWAVSITGQPAFATPASPRTASPWTLQAAPPPLCCKTNARARVHAAPTCSISLGRPAAI